MVGIAGSVIAMIAAAVTLAKALSGTLRIDLSNSDDALSHGNRKSNRGIPAPSGEVCVKMPLDYEIRVSGPVPESVLVETEGLKIVNEPVHTILRGPVADQAALHGIINRLQRLGLELIEVRRVGPHPTDADPGGCPGRARDVTDSGSQPAL